MCSVRKLRLFYSLILFDVRSCALILHTALLPTDPPEVEALEPVLLVVNHTEIVNFTCQAYGIPRPNLTWVNVSDETVVMDVIDDIEITEQIVDMFTLRSVLTFLNTTKTDESVYRCEGFNGVTNVINTPENDTITLLVDGMVTTGRL